MKNKLLLFLLLTVIICMNALATTWTSYPIVQEALKGYVKVSNPVFSPDGNTIYIPTSTPNGHLFAVNRADGSIKWVFQISTITYGGGSVVGSDGTIYQGARDKKVYAINPDGTQKWVFTGLGNFDVFPALSADGVLYCIANGSVLHALNAGTGAEIWNRTLTGTTGGALAIDNGGNIYAGTNSKVVKYNAAGDLQWETDPLNVTEIGSFAIDGTTLYAALKAGAGIAAVNMTDGNIKWTYANGSSSDAYFPIVGSDGTIYFNEKAGNKSVYAVNPDGTLKWSTAIGAAMNYGGLVLSNAGKLYGGTQAKIGTYYQVFEVDASTGDTTVLLNSNHQFMAAATIGPDNKLYLGSIREGASPLEDNGRLFVFDIEAGLEKSSWSMRGRIIHGTSLAATKLSTPTVGAASAITSTGFTANWTAVDDASAYDVFVYQGETLISTTNFSGQPTNSGAITGLLPNTTYTYKVIARGDDWSYIDSNSSADSDSFSTLQDILSGSVFGEQPNVQVFVNHAKQVRIVAPKNSSYAIYNTMGQFIEHGTLSSEQFTVISKLHTGVYMVKVNNITTRLIVK